MKIPNNTRRTILLPNYSGDLRLGSPSAGAVSKRSIGYPKPSLLGFSGVCVIWNTATTCDLALLFSLSLLVQGSFADQGSPNDQKSSENLAQLSLGQLGDVEVTTASKQPQQVQKTSAAVFVITQEDIRRSGATCIPEALRLAPGVQVPRIDGDHWSISIRGFAGQFAKSLLVLIDGRSVYTPLYAGVYWDVQNVMMEDVERIEVIRGPGGTIWGANAVNGVINISTKSSSEAHGTLVALGGGNVDQGTGDARYGGSVGNNFNYRIYGTGDMRGPEFHSDNDGFDRWRMGQMGFPPIGSAATRITSRYKAIFTMRRAERGSLLLLFLRPRKARQTTRGTPPGAIYWRAGSTPPARAPTFRCRRTSIGPTGKTWNSVKRENESAGQNRDIRMWADCLLPTRDRVHAIWWVFSRYSTCRSTSSSTKHINI